jgi:uncharacterized protein (TIGR02646 family)
MICLNFNTHTIENNALEFLENKQNQVNQQVLFAEKVTKAVLLWDNKTKSKSGKAVFQSIRENLKAFCIARQYCCYCEHNIATDIEHIFPKSLFPQFAFVWRNYILACKQCNTTYKADNFAVFDPAGTTNFVEHKTGMPSQPLSTDDAVFINPRQIDPLSILWLNLQTGIFDVHPDFDTISREKIKADYTLKVLNLNAHFAKSRVNAAREFVKDLRQYVDIQSCSSFDDLKKCLYFPDEVDEIISFDEVKLNALNAIESRIKQRTHFTVWRELKRQQALFPANFPTVNQLFLKAPQVLDW